MQTSEIVVVVLTVWSMVICLALVRAYNRHRIEKGPLEPRLTDTVAWMTALGLAAIVGLTITAISVIANTWR